MEKTGNTRGIEVIYFEFFRDTSYFFNDRNFFRSIFLSLHLHPFSTFFLFCTVTWKNFGSTHHIANHQKKQISK